MTRFHRPRYKCHHKSIKYGRNFSISIGRAKAILQKLDQLTISSRHGRTLSAFRLISDGRATKDTPRRKRFAINTYIKKILSSISILFQLAAGPCAHALAVRARRPFMPYDTQKLPRQNYLIMIVFPELRARADTILSTKLFLPRSASPGLFNRSRARACYHLPAATGTASCERRARRFWPVSISHIATSAHWADRGLRIDRYYSADFPEPLQAQQSPGHHFHHHSTRDSSYATPRR